MTLYVPAKEFEGELWVRASDFQKAVSEAEGRSIAEAEQQEPVAIADGTFNHNCPVGVPLYTTPPHRKPLTDEEILSVARNHYNPHERAEISFARAIEAAHGIKE